MCENRALYLEKEVQSLYVLICKVLRVELPYTGGTVFVVLRPGIARFTAPVGDDTQVRSLRDPTRTKKTLLKSSYYIPIFRISTHAPLVCFSRCEVSHQDIPLDGTSVSRYHGNPHVSLGHVFLTSPFFSFLIGPTFSASCRRTGSLT